MLLLTEGWDNYTTFSTDGFKQNWQAIQGTTLPTIQVAGGRFGDNGIRFTAIGGTAPGASHQGDFFASSLNGVGDAYTIVACWFKINQKPTSTQNFIQGVAGNNASWNITNLGQLICNTNFFLAYGGNVADNQWHWFEGLTATPNASGTVAAYLDGRSIQPSTTTNIGTFTNQNNITLTASGNVGNLIDFDDFFWWNNMAGSQTGELTSASFPIGPKRIRTLRATGAGSFTGWTPDSGSNFARINETLADDDTSYVSATGSGVKDTYAYGDLGGTDTNPLLVNIKVRGKNNSTGSSNYRGVTYSSATLGNGDSKNCTNAYNMVQCPIFRDPATSAAWTASGVNNAEFGVAIV